MDILYQVSDHVRYWIYPGGTPSLVTGRITQIGETSHKTAFYRVKRDHSIQANLGMYETDEVSPLNILGIVPIEK